MTRYSSKKNDALGTRMKMYEYLSPSGGVFMPHLPIVCRMDGRNFSKWTKKLRRPYDGRLSRLMIEVTKLLVNETGAKLGYTQSDEITLVLFSEDIDTQLYYGSKVSKIVSHLGGLTGLFFNRLLPDLIPEKMEKFEEHEESCVYHNPSYSESADFPAVCECGVWTSKGRVSNSASFDARAFNVPNLDEAANAVLWREIDATRNSVSMAARHYYSHKELYGQGRADCMDLLMKVGVNWNDYPAFFKRGSYIRRQLFEGDTRAKTRTMEWEPLRSYDHATRVSLLFGG